MSRFIPRSKKIVAGVSTIAVLSFISIQELKADTTTPAATTTAAASSSGTASASTGAGTSPDSGVLQQIAQYTNGTLTAVTSTTNPVVTAIVTALTNLTSPDNATNPPSPTPTMQQGFTTYATQTAASSTAQTALIQTLTAPLFSNFTTTSVPYANDLNVTNILQATPTLFFNPDPRPNPSTIDPALNYITYASGMGIQHAIPDKTWSGSPQSQFTYNAYFGTITAVETFNAYILSQLYEDIKNGVPAAQTALINQASDPTNWFATITTESIGAVLRQTLMYQSQSYIVMTQILQTEKMLLAAQSMSITMGMLTSLPGENMAASKAIRTLPGG
jgi:hypothetical protein